MALPRCTHIGSAKEVPKVRLSDVGLRALQPPPKGTVDYWDESFPSFACRVSQGGTKTFILKLLNSRRTIGRYPLLSLAEARAEARRILAERTLGKLRPVGKTFAAAKQQFLEEKSLSGRPSSVQSLKERLNRHFDFKGNLADVTHEELVRRLKRISTNGEHDHALTVAKIFFNWAIAHRYLTDNPATGICRRGSTSRSRVLTDNEIKLVWRVCEGRSCFKTGHGVSITACKRSDSSTVRIPDTFHTIVQLLILTGMRRGECAALQSSWIDFENNTITIPATATKNGRQHVFPIGTLAKSLLSSTWPSELKQQNILLFPARGKTAAPFNGWSKAKAAIDKATGVHDWTLHDLRRTYASNLARLGVRLEIIERLLNHVSGSFSGIVGVYQRYDFMPEMQAAVETYETNLRSILQHP